MSAALRWLEHYLAESSPRLQHFAEKATSLAKPGDVESGALRYQSHEVRNSFAAARLHEA